MGWEVHVARMWEKGNTYRILVGKAEGRRSVLRCKSTRENNIKMDVKEAGRQGVDWTDLSQDRDKRLAVVITAMNHHTHTHTHTHIQQQLRYNYIR
jgi:hypothetical protein